MVVDRTLYDILGVDTNASQQDIVRAFREKSLEHHPDRGGSVEMMQKINAAREILADPDKRETYDRYGLDGMKSSMGNDGGSGFSVFDIFNLFSNGRGRREQSRVSKGSDIKHVLKVSLEELYTGATKKVEIDRDAVCTNCKGSGSNDGIERKCRECEGSGIEILVYRMGPMIQQTQSPCSTCHGSGNEVDPKNRCKKCSSKKFFRETKVLDVNIAHGSQNGETIKFMGEGNQFPNGQSGTVYVVLKQEPHPIFNRNNDDLVMKMEINLAESLCGFQRLIKLLDGHQILINHPPGIPILPNSYRVIRGHGMPDRHSHSHGDLIIQFTLKFPENNFITTESQRKQLESVLPSKSQVKLNSKEHYEEAQMSEYDIHREQFQKQQFQNNHHHHHHHQADDDYDHFEQPQNVQCQTQ